MGMSYDLLADFGEIDCGNGNLINANDSFDLGVARTTAAGVVIGRDIWQGDRQVCIHFEVTEAFATGAGARAQFGCMYSPDGTNHLAVVQSYIPILTGGPGLTHYMVPSNNALALGVEFLIPVPRPSRFIAGADLHPLTVSAVLTGKHRYLYAVMVNPSPGPAAFTAGKVRARLVYNPSMPVDSDMHEINSSSGFSVI